MDTYNNTTSPPKGIFNEKNCKNFFQHFYSFNNHDEIPDSGMIQTDLAGKITDISKEILDILEVKKKDCLGRDLLTYLQITETSFFKKLVLNEVSLQEIFSNIIKTNKKLIPCKIRINKQVDYNEKLCGFIFLITDIDNKKLSLKNQDHFQKDAILQSLIFASEQILLPTESISKGSIGKILFHLGISTRANRVAIFKNATNEYGSNIMELLYEWHSPNLFPIKKQSALNNYRYDPHVFKKLSKGEIFQIQTKLLKEPDELILKDHLVKAFIFIPIFSDMKFYGILALADCEKPRVWPKEVIDGLLTAARLIGHIIKKAKDYNLIPTPEKQRLLKNPADPFCIIDHNQQTIFASPGLESIIGYNYYEISNIPFSSLIRSERNNFLKKLERLKSSKKHFYDLEVEIRTEKEQWIPVSIDLKRIEHLDSHQGLIQIDVKERITKPKNTKRKHEKIDTNIILQELPNPLCITDSSNNFLYANKSFNSKLYDTIKNSTLGKSPEELPQQLEFITKSLFSEVTKKTFLQKDDETDSVNKIFEITRIPVINERNHLLYNLWNAEDKTQQINFKKRILSIEKMYRKIFENIPLAFFLKDSKGRYIYTNKYLQSLYHFKDFPADPETVFPKEMVKKFIMEDLKATREGFTKTSCSVQIKNINRKFKKIKFPINTGSAEPIIAGIAIDITD